MIVPGFTVGGIFSSCRTVMGSSEIHCQTDYEGKLEAQFVEKVYALLAAWAVCLGIRASNAISE
jgi:hypothetical protein